MHMPQVISDPRTEKQSERSIAMNIVQGVLAETGLPKVSNIISGVDPRAHLVGMPPGTSKGAKTPTVSLPASDRDRTVQAPGAARYLATQKKKGRK
jgi:hypothetical protein